MLDQKLEPWLLEVNLSPACAERTEWLVDMLDRMASGLLDHLERRFSKVADDFKGDLRGYLGRKKGEQARQLGRNEDWILIYDQAEASQNYQCFAKSVQA
tara:strand:+ start:829 stop:1128 length:300 start_codon:yes stop_codon:yes gene_type:complete